jgi:hypothetical protein
MGSLVGALTPFLTTYVNKRNQSRRDFLNKQFAQRETLYSDFINEAARLFADSREHHFERIDTLVPIYALLNRIRLNGSEEAVRAAQKTIENIITSYDHPNLTIEELHNLPSNGSDPLREFGEACRKELIRSIGKLTPLVVLQRVQRNRWVQGLAFESTANRRFPSSVLAIFLASKADGGQPINFLKDTREMLGSSESDACGNTGYWQIGVSEQRFCVANPRVVEESVN